MAEMDDTVSNWSVGSPDLSLPLSIKSRSRTLTKLSKYTIRIVGVLSPHVGTQTRNRDTYSSTVTHS
jgi:hypothetical protein